MKGRVFRFRKNLDELFFQQPTWLGELCRSELCFFKCRTWLNEFAVKVRENFIIEF